MKCKANILVILSALVAGLGLWASNGAPQAQQPGQIDELLQIRTESERSSASADAELPKGTVAVVDFPLTLGPDAPEQRDLAMEFDDQDFPTREVGYQSIDLNGDGRPERFFYVSGPLSCGAGNCAVRAYTGTLGGQPILKISTTPILFVLKTETNKFRDIAVPGTGPRRGKYIIWRFDGLQYN